MTGFKLIFSVFVTFVMALSTAGFVSSQKVHQPVILEDVLPSTYVTDVEKDSNGFMWIATANGLVRYDGSAIEVFRHDRNKAESLRHNQVSAILFDRERNLLWIATPAGLSFLELAKNRVSNISMVGKLAKGSDGAVGALMLDDRGDLWFSLEGTGIAMYDYEADSMTTFPLEIEPEIPLQKRLLIQVLTVQQDILDKDQIWLGTAGGLLRFDREKKNYSTYYFLNSNQENQGHSNQIRSVLPISDGRLWIGTWSQGLIRFNPDRSSVGNSFISPHQFENFHSSGSVPPLFMANEKQAWYNSLSSCLLDIQSGELSDCFSMRNQLGKPYGIQINLIDEADRLWATSEYGLQIFDPISMQIDNYQFEAKDQIFYVDGSFIELDNGDLLMTYEHGEGAYLFDLESGVIDAVLPSTQSFVTEGAFKGQGFIKRPNGDIWLVELQKIYRFDPATLQLQPLNLPIDQLPFLWTSVMQDKRGALWLGTRSDGIIFFDPGTNTITSYKDELVKGSEDPPTWIDNLHEDKAGNIWISKDRGLSIYIQKEERFLNFDSIQGEEFQTTNFIEDQQGNIWSAARDFGLLMMNSHIPDGGIRKVIGKSEGLKVDGIISISFDANGAIWMITDFGLQRYDPSTGQAEMFGTSDGMITYDARFHRNPSVLTNIGQLSDGKMAYVPRAGLSIFDPDEMKMNTEIPQPYIKEIRVTDSVLLKDLFGSIDDMSFNARQNEIEIECSAIGYSQSNHMVYEYRLGDSTWKKMNNRRVLLSSLSADDYLFEFRVKNSRGIPSKILSWHFNIKLPWWKSWWFITVLTLSIFGIVYWIVKDREERHLKAQKKEQEIELMLANLESRALRNQMNPHFLFNIFNNIQELILTGDTEKAYTYTTKFSKLLRTILVDTRKDEITIEQECAFLQLYLELESLRFDDAFNYEMKVEEGLELMHIPVFVIQPLVENAIRHGLLPQDGTKQLEIRFYSDDEHVICTVTDNGVGLNGKQTSHKPMDRDHAIQLIKNRLRILNGATLKIIERTDGPGLISKISIPMN